MKTVNIHEAKTQLSRLIAEVVAGDEVVIAKAGKPLVRLVAMAASDGPRPLGQLAGRVVEANNCWDQDPEIDITWPLLALQTLLRSSIVTEQVRAHSVQMRGGAD